MIVIETLLKNFFWFVQIKKRKEKQRKIVNFKLFFSSQKHEKFVLFKGNLSKLFLTSLCVDSLLFARFVRFHSSSFIFG